jgi:hypothetical protein
MTSGREVGVPEIAPFDQDALLAAVDLVGRTGAHDFEVGWLNDEDDPAYAERGPEWWAKAKYEGRRIDVEGFARPDVAAHALAVRLLTGAKCRCGRLVALSDDGATAYPDVEMADGTRWTAEEARAAGQCRWRRNGAKWEPSCPNPGPNRAQRRRRR